MVKVGDRLGAIASGDQEEVRIYGYGVYIGHEIPSAQCGGLGPTIREQGRTNPTIKLDSGKVVYGCECWWGPEEKIREAIGPRRVVVLDIDEERAKVAAKQGHETGNG